MLQDVNQLVYGITIPIAYKNVKSSQSMIFISPNECRMMQIVDVSNNKNFLVDLTEIINIEKTNDLRLKIKNNQGHNLKIYCSDPIMQNSIEKGLVYLIEQAIKIQKQLDSINQVWSNALKIITRSDFDMNLQLSLQEFQYLLGELQINISERKLCKLFETHQIENQIAEQQLFHLITQFTRKDEIFPLYQKYCSKKESMFQDIYQTPLMTYDDIQTFFLIEQGEQFKGEQKCYNFYEFQNLIFQNDNSVFQYKKVDELHSITSYLINSSHNTYLEANQLTGESSSYAYVQAFKFGAKCVELDCWDGEDGEPVVTHGHTLVNKILFKDVIKAVKDFGFCVDEYPVILSFEMHCKAPQQRKIAQILIDILEGMLLRIDNYNRLSLPTLQELKRKVIVKNKGDKNYMEKMKMQSVKDFKKSSTENELFQFDDDEEEVAKFDQSLPTEKLETMNEALMDVTTLFAIPLDLDKQRESVWTISSIAEDQIKKLIEKKHAQVVEFAKKYFLRVYPLGLRFDSSNYDGMPSWCVGAQMVALNLQTKDLFMLINQGRFMNSTYVLKENDDFSLKITIRIISASHLIWEEQKRRQEEVVDPYVKVRIAGHAEDEKNASKWRTKVVNDNGYHPVYDYECQILLHYAHQAVIYFQAYSYSILGDTLIGQYALPATNLRKGYRVVPLMNSQFQPISNSFVLIHVKLEGP